MGSAAVVAVVALSILVVGTGALTTARKLLDGYEGTLRGRFLALAKGQVGEWRVRRILGALDPAEYRTFHDLYLPRPGGGGTSQVDHLVVSAYGVFVVETKNISGLIDGHPNHAEWRLKSTPTSRGRRIYNPLRQNRGHVRAAAAFLGLKPREMRSIVFFAGSARPLSDLGDDVLFGAGLVDRITSHTSLVLDEATVRRCVTSLHDLGRSVNRRQVRRDHIRQAKLATARAERRRANRRRRRNPGRWEA